MITYKYIGSQQSQKDGYYRPCYDRCVEEEGCQRSECMMDAAPMYRVHNLNPDRVAGALNTNYDIVTDTLLVPKGLLDAELEKNAEMTIKRYHYYDTHYAPPMLSGKEEQQVIMAYDPMTKPCIRLEPCGAMPSAADACCETLVPPRLTTDVLPANSKELSSTLEEQLTAFEQTSSALAYASLPTPRPTLEERQAELERLFKEKEAAISQLADEEANASMSALSKYGFRVLVWVFVAVATLLVIGALVALLYGIYSK